MPSQLLNFILFQIGWFACVLPAAAGFPWVGPVYVTTWTVLFAWRLGSLQRAACLLPVAFGVGYLFDSALVRLGWMAFPPITHLAGPAPLWMAFMWVNLAATLDACLSWLRGRFVLGAILGFVGGPLAYWGGDRLGGVELLEPVPLSLLAVAVEWAVAFPLLLWVNEKILRPGNP